MSDTITKFGPISFITGTKGGRYPYCHSLYIEEAGVVIDPASCLDQLQEIARSGQAKSVWLSHWHEDHIMYLNLFEELPIWMHEADVPPMKDLDTFIDWYFYSDSEYESMRESWRQMMVEMFNYQPRKISRFLKDGEIIDLGSVTVEILHSPGHSPGSLSFYFREPQVLFLGDTDLTPFGPWYGDLYSDIDAIYQTVERLRNIPAKIWLTGHEQGIFESNPGSLWDDYLQVIQTREDKLLDFLTEPRNMKEIADQWIIYGKPKKPVEMFALLETISMSKHLDRLLKKEVVESDGDRYWIK
ncbi:MAG: MBL fold metallo-hydrolase [Deltaproteobacteria bacterium]|nr:MBL fold metallo-hydrolase [Deltaproteobacteria bacterium]MBT4263509.1 MBL fold metallo-hydrolase [Deltaproteobacteria bacterium]MBT4642400.1 MBL fold metallo-hydrolase [Deltaproteobacteria bacterium]MBT6502237.1 MBL fold metallo-hydrolase [Deltaproteobacteria bacterium]MBT7151652.1 MBL fold metallo-hydrolase [Deltaproteobacteria bacterium]